MYGLIARTAKKHFDRKVRRLKDMKGVLSNVSNATSQVVSPASLAQKLRGAFKVRSKTACDDNVGVSHPETNDQAAADLSSGPRGHADLVPPSTLASFRWIKQMVVVFGLFTVFWTPAMVHIILSFAYTINYQVLAVLFTLGIANSAVNFFVYSYYNSKFCEVIRNMVSYCCKCWRT